MSNYLLIYLLIGMGICKMDEQNNLTEVVETKNIVKIADGAEADGVSVDVDSLVSMNMWGFRDFDDLVCESRFKKKSFYDKVEVCSVQEFEQMISLFL